MWTEKKIETKRFDTFDDRVIPLNEISSGNTNPKWPGIVVFLNSFGVVWTGTSLSAAPYRGGEVCVP